MHISHRLSSSSSSSSSSGASSSGSHHSRIASILALLAKLGLGVIGVGGLYAGYVYYEVQKRDQELKRQEEAEKDLVPLPPMPDAYVHPYTHWPWPKRYYFLVTRTAHLIYLWAPCIGMTIYTFLRGKLTDKEWVDWLLETMVNTLEKSGAGFQKFGQWVAMRPDLFPKRLCQAMAKLQDDSPSHPFETTRETIREAFGKDIQEIFTEFDLKPVASGSVGQVHRAVLREEYALPDGTREVAVKVRHPKVLDSSFADVWLIFWMMRMSPNLGLKICIPFKEEEFYNNIQKQVDFTWEAFNLLKFNRNFKNDRALSGGDLTVKFPLVHTDLLTESVLIESWAPGENIASMLARKASRSKVWEDHLNPNLKHDILDEENHLSAQELSLRKEIALRCCDIAAKMFLRDNYIHGDLHAGNLIFSAKDNLITVVDAGLTTFLEDDSFVPFGDFLRALCIGDANVIVEKLVEFNVNDAFEKRDVPKFTAEISGILDKYMGADRARQEDQLVMGYIMGEVLNTIGKYHITLKGDVSSSLMTISISEGLVLSLDPTFDLVGRTLPYFVRYAGWETLAAVRTGGYYSTNNEARAMVSKGDEEH
eukprot:CAMPEP_0184479850 /NCGR_PEP_ID=MMETSP0113_2-20130426/1409_1 /TAXON_ID=91329 /ORGANISM="Norrisiella sphaerica, Strain BC52" /LENGTH=592 /DNA_ID=CAMNT_0026858011 /DNA_START=638 /DNA_END=2416 /DNA_ORIENTATION=+